MTKKNILSESLINLMEDEMDRAELVLAAKAILDKLQNMAEDLAKVEADDVLPLLDGIRSQFGPQFADQLNSAATESLRQALEAVKTSKDQIGQAIQNMQGVVTGEGSNDMATNTGTAGEMPADPTAQGAPVGDAGVGGVPAAQGADDGSAEMADEIDALVGGSEENGDAGPDGRTRKESVTVNGAVLSEAQIELMGKEDPDTFLAKTVMAYARAKQISVTESANDVAQYYSVDVEDVVGALREYVEALKMDKLLAEDAKRWAKQALTFKLAMKEGKDVAVEGYLTADRLNAANALASGKITEAQCVKLAKI